MSFRLIFTTRTSTALLATLYLIAQIAQGNHTRLASEPSWQLTDPEDETFSDPEIPEDESIEERIARIQSELEAAKAEMEEKVIKGESVEEIEIPMGALVVISSKQSNGSGFIGEMRGKTFLITNIHVLGLAKEATIKTLDGVTLNLSSDAYISKERDIAIVPLKWGGDTFLVSESIKDDQLKIGNQVTLMGNSDGTGVATRLRGAVDGIGPEELQVSAKFVPGNSGSPIVANNSGKVVAIASYMRDLSDRSKWTEDSELDDIRRFGYRLDGEIEWGKISLQKLYEQAEAFHSFKDRTLVIGHIAYTMESEQRILTGYRAHESLGYLIGYFDDDFQWQRGTDSAKNTRLLKRFTQGLMTELESDRTSTEKILNINFYKHQFTEMQDARDAISETLNRFHSSL